MTKPIKTFNAYLDEVAAGAREKGVSAELAGYAKQQTGSYLKMNRGELAPKDCKRIRAYFWAIVKKRAPKDKASADLNQRVILNVFVDTLKKGGRTSADIADELVRNYASVMKKEIIDEYLTVLHAA